MSRRDPEKIRRKGKRGIGEALEAQTPKQGWWFLRKACRS